MSIIRAKKTNGSFYQADKVALYDSRLTPNSKYIMSYVASKPDDWNFYITEAANHADISVPSLSRAIKQLEEYGYVNKKHVITNRGRQVEYTFYENPNDNDEFSILDDDDLMDDVLNN
ncbi:hypothetical protein [Staphylococcus phage PT94]